MTETTDFHGGPAQAWDCHPTVGDTSVVKLCN